MWSRILKYLNYIRHVFGAVVTNMDSHAYKPAFSTCKNILSLSTPERNVVSVNSGEYRKLIREDKPISHAAKTAQDRENGSNACGN